MMARTVGPQGGWVMATFVLVHGAWHGSWCWKRVRKALQSEGHEVFTPTLTGIGERSHLISPQVTLDTHIADVVNLIRWEELTDVVLCGHSYGGCVITGAADRVAERIEALVYLDAFILGDGQGLHDLLPPEVRDAQVKGAALHGHGWQVQPISAEFFQVNAADRAWVDRQCTPQPLATFAQPVRLRNAFPAAKCTHILATGYEHSPFPPFHEIAKTKGWRTSTIDCGHDVMLDRPNELVGMLLEAARP
jgi:pimeloyl-ACP methyl ester carboxylesterase